MSPHFPPPPMRLPAIILFLAIPSLASINVGEAPELKLAAIDGSTINLAKHKGKLILIDFWAGRSDLNRRHEQDLVDAFKTYADQGVVFIGINCDTHLSDARQYINDLKITWPQYWESKGWRDGVAKDFGVARLPTDFLIGPDGNVVWTGSSSHIDNVLSDQLILHPPQLVEPDVLDQANHSLDEVENALKADDRATAIGKFARIPDMARRDKSFASRWEALKPQVDEAADKLVAEIDPLVENKQYAEAMTKLKALVVTVTGTGREPVIRKKINDLLTNPDAKAAITHADQETSGAAALAAAKRLRDSGEDIAAYTHFKGVTQDYPKTRAAEAAQNAVSAYEKDAAFMRKLNDTAIATKAKAALNLADNYRRAGRSDLAKTRYESIVKDYPDTPYAEQAQQSLDQMK